MPTSADFNQWLDHYLYRPDYSTKLLMQKKIEWIWTVAAGTGVFLMTLFSWIMGAWTLVKFGIVLLFFYALFIPFFRYVRDFERWNFYFLLLVIFIAFLTILKLGGILHSMGVIFVGLTCSMASALFSRIKLAVITFLFYALTIIAAGLLQPFLTPAPEVTPSKNLLFYVVNIVWISGSTLNFIVDFMKQRSKLEEEKTLRLQELDEVKTKLYTNITHEFRTPLTIILGMVGHIRQNTEKWLNDGLEMIERNSLGLLRLVNRMLDLQKLESGVLPLNLVQSDIIPFLKYLTGSFYSLAETKNIRLEFSAGTDALLMDYDPEKLQDVLFNLLSNAIKYTPEHGSVIVSVNAEQTGGADILRLEVQDTGTGIAEEELPKIFDRFYQVKETGFRKTGGTGIGLALSRELTRLMGGEINAESELGRGTTFILRLPVTRQAPHVAFNLAEIVERPTGFSKAELKIEKKILPVENDNRPLVLVVEDNADMVRYIVACLEEEFRLLTSVDGKAGLATALEIIPDLIITDVMMPKMDGFELCKNLKADFRTSHIPVVMLTAKADLASKIEGFETGADVYLTKPFHQEEMLVRLRKLIELRKKLQLRYSLPDALSPSDDKTVQREDVFIEKVRSLVLANLSDENFGIPQLCRELAMSRAQLYRKFHAITDQPVAKFIRKIRLFRAKELLKNNQLNVTEVAFEAGFRNLSHFSTAFKEEFGISPSDVAGH